MNADQEAQEQARDYWRAKTTLDHFFLKCETGMQTVEDVNQAKEAMKYFGIEVN